MFSDTLLREIYGNNKRYLANTLIDHSGDDDPHGIYTTCHDAAFCHHNLAVLAFVLDADEQGFYQHLYQSASCRRYYLLKTIAGMPSSASHLAATVDEYLFDAIASGYERIPVFLSRAMVERKHSRLDSYERFAYSSLIRVLIDRNASSQLKDEHFKALHHANKEDPRLRCAVAISNSNASVFSDAFAALLELRQNEIASTIVTNEPDMLIFVEGLALLRIARMVGINVDMDSAMVPGALLTNAVGDPPDDGYPKLSNADAERIKKRLG